MRATLKRSIPAIALSLFTIGNVSSFTALSAVLAGIGILSTIQSATAQTFAGYTATGVNYNFVNPSTPWTSVNFGSNLNDGVGTATLPFAFNFFGVSYSSGSNLSIGTNGVLSFGSSGITSEDNVSLTDPSPPVTPNVPTIAVLWDDWTLQNNENNTNNPVGSVRYQTAGSPGNRQFIVQWNNVRRVSVSQAGPNETATFQAILYEGSNNILFSYTDVNVGNPNFNNGKDATVGIRDTDGNTQVTKRLQWSYNSTGSGYVAGGKGICFRQNSNPPTPTPCP